MRRYFRDLYRSVYTVLIGLRITLRYAFAKPITVQYPDAAPPIAPKYRGFHYFLIEECIGCDLCAKACPVDCIYIEKSGARKIDKATNIARGGAMQRFAIDYSKCMFCALCVEPCPTECIHMGDIHDLSGYDRNSMIVEFTDLAKEGLRTPVPLWMQRDDIPEWAAARKQHWLTHGRDRQDEMTKALRESAPAKPPAAASSAAPPSTAGAASAPASAATAAAAPKTPAAAVAAASPASTTAASSSATASPPPNPATPPAKSASSTPTEKSA
ncbi:MAG: NADH-quinone oxidoreductase subunit I [Phycisphaerae bacterium]